MEEAVEGAAAESEEEEGRRRDGSANGSGARTGWRCKKIGTVVTGTLAVIDQLLPFCNKV